MTESTSKMIIARRAGGGGDITSDKIADGDMSLEEAETHGIFKVNCTHQIGIATETEVGLSAHRFPIRVILSTDTGVAREHTDDTVSGFWPIINSAGAPIPFARKPFGSVGLLERLYTRAADLDSRLWAAYGDLADGRAAFALPNDMGALLDEFLGLLRVQNPTTEQMVQYNQSFEDIFARAKENGVAPFFPVGDNVYLRGVPHGREYRQVNTMLPDRVALYEVAACILVNNSRMAARYPDVSGGTILLAASAVAQMFRMGLAESYEHREYYTIVCTPAVNDDKMMKIAAIERPRGAPELNGLTVGETINIGGVKMSSKRIQLANMLVMASGLMHYQHNHTTGGTSVQGVLLSVLSMYSVVTHATSDAELKNITSVMYEALHPTNKRAIANLMFQHSGVRTYGRCSLSPPAARFSMDSFATLRRNPYPAGSHKAYTCMMALDRVLQANLAPFLPWAGEILACVQMCSSVLRGGATAHIGSSYYTGDPPNVQPSSLDRYLPDLAMFIQTFHKGDSLSFSPSLGVEMSKRAAVNWANLLRDVKAKDVSATDADTVKAYLKSAGIAQYELNPDDQTTWAAATNVTRTALVSIRELLTTD